MTPPDLDGLQRLQARQAGVVSRRQVRGHGLGDPFVARMLRNRRWARVHDGVYVDHTGPPSWEQRAWGAVLAHAPAALAGRSALRAHGIGSGGLTGHAGRDEVVHLVVPGHRRAVAAEGVWVRRLTDWDRHVRPDDSPPRARIEHAALCAASEASRDDAAAALLGDVVRSRRTTPARLAETLALMPRLPRRRMLSDLVSDVALGATSALEVRYLRDVERVHGLPTGTRQRRVVAEAGGSVSYCDVEYVAHGVVLELDGRLGHDAGLDRWRDFERDLSTAARGVLTLRAGWGTVLAPCRFAELVAAVLAVRGWTAQPRRCSAACPLPTRAG